MQREATWNGKAASIIPGAPFPQLLQPCHHQAAARGILEDRGRVQSVSQIQQLRTFTGEAASQASNHCCCGEQPNCCTAQGCTGTSYVGGHISTCRFSQMEALVPVLAQPIQARIGGPVRPVMRIWRDTQHPSGGGALRVPMLLQTHKERTLPHLAQIIVHSILAGLALASDKRPLVLPPYRTMVSRLLVSCW